MNTINKKVLQELVNIFSDCGLTEDHITTPENYPDFVPQYSLDSSGSIPPKGDTSSGQFNEQKILIKITQEWINSSATNTAKFSLSLYESLAKDNLVNECPGDPDEYTKWVNTGKRRVGRILKGEYDLPLSWKHHWLSCLPENLTQFALTQMVAATGYMLLPLPVSSVDTVTSSQARIDDLSRQFADVISKSKPAMDGSYDHNDDREELQLLQDELAQLIAAALRESTVIEANTGVVSQLRQIWASSPLNRKK